MSVPHPHTSAFVKHFLHQHPHLPTQLSAHLRDDPDGFNAVVGEWHEASRDGDGHHSDEPFDVSHSDARRLLAMAMVDAEMEAQASGEPLSDEVRENYRSLADDGHLAAVLGMHPEDPIQKAWDSKSHPRSDDGRFIKKGDIEAAKADPEKAKALLARTTKPAERAKLEKVLGGETAPGQSKGDDRKQATKEKKEKVQASRSRAAELAAKATRGDATREELAELADHLPALNVKQLRQVRAALYAKLGGVTRRDEILAKIKDHAKGMAEGDTQHARKQDEAAQERKVRKAEREAKQKKLRAQIKHYGYINPSDSAFTAFGSMSEAVRDWGFSVGMFRKDSRMGFDEIAEAMIRDGHLTQPESQNATDALWQRLTEDADSMLADRKDEVAEAQEAYHKELAAVAADKGINYDGQDLTADDLFGDDEQSATAYRGAEESVAEAVASDPFGAGGSGSQDPWDEPATEPEPASEVTPTVSEIPAEKSDSTAEPVKEKEAKVPYKEEAESETQAKEGGEKGGDFDFSHEDGYSGEIQTKKVGNSTLVYRMNRDGNVELSSVRTPAKHRGGGEGRVAVQSLLDEADRNGKTVELLASPLDGKTKLSKLVKFYESMGFEVAGRGNPAGDPKMVRKPQARTASAPEPVSQKPVISDAGKQADSGKQPTPDTAGPTPDIAKPGSSSKPVNSGNKPVVATRPLVKPKPKADAPREKTEAELEREQRADIDAKVAEDKRQKKLAAGGEDTPDDFAPLPETGGKATLADPKQPNLAGDDPYADDKFHGTVAESFSGDTPAERFKTAQSASEGKRKAAAKDAGMTLAEFDAELAKRLEPPAKEPSRDEQLAALLKEQEDDAAPKKKKRKKGPVAER